MKKIIKNIWKNKIYSFVFLAIILIASVIYYAICFYDEQSLQFTSEDSFILGIQGIGFLILSVLTIWLIIDRQKVYNILKRIFDQITDNQDEVLQVNRDTQQLIIKLFKKKWG